MAEDRRLERIESKIDDQNDHLTSIDVTLGKQHISLDHHMRRTSILEIEVKSVKKYVYMMQGAIALLTIMATVIGILVSTGIIK